jgi:gamma-glutamyl-gamma-aminobutyrate hydrolase PuuD
MALFSRANIFVVGKPYNGITSEVFLSTGRYKLAPKLKDADIVVWTGGEDINPRLYDETPLNSTYFSDRDISDIEAVKDAVAHSKFLVGICRGAQLLNVVVNGGKLWQDVDNHDGRNHRAFDCVSGSWVVINSVHHQMMRPTSEAELLCWAYECTRKEAQHDLWNRPHTRVGDHIEEADRDVEALWYPKTDSLLVQFHPEFGHPPTTKYFHELMDKYYWSK